MYPEILGNLIPNTIAYDVATTQRDELDKRFGKLRQHYKLECETKGIKSNYKFERLLIITYYDIQHNLLMSIMYENRRHMPNN